MQKYAIQIYVFKFVKSQNKFISYFEYSTTIIKKYANVTNPEPYILYN